MSESSQAAGEETAEEQPGATVEPEDEAAIASEPAGTFTAPVNVGIASGLQFRVDERFEVDGNAEVVVRSDSIGTTLLRGNILDISATGCYIQTVARVPITPGTEVHINFSIHGRTFRVEAISRFAKTKVGIGFRFLEMDSTVRRRLHEALAKIRLKAIRDDPLGTLPVVERTPLE